MAAQAATAASESVGRDSDRLDRLASALEQCRRRSGEASPVADRTPPGSPEDAAAALRRAVAAELADAAAALPDELREVLALRDGLGLEHREVAQVVGVDEPGAALLLARARLALRDARRGSGLAQDSGECGERARALRLLARRQDGESADEDAVAWLRGHLAGCEPCRRAHGAMLEASVSYRAWRIE